MDNEKILLGLHDYSDIDRYTHMFEDYGFIVDSVSSLKSMLEKIAQSEYGWYLMDAN